MYFSGVTPEAQVFAGATAALFFFFYYLNWLVDTRDPLFIAGGSPKILDIIAKCPTLWRQPIPPFFFSNPNAQFIPYLIINIIHGWICPMDYQRVTNVTPDGLDVSVVDVFPRFDDTPEPLPLVIICPGLTSGSQDMPGISIAKRIAATKRYRVVAHHRRGHVVGEEGKLKAGIFHFAGDMDDIAATIRNLREKFPDQCNVPFFILGLSLGCLPACVCC